MTNIYSIPEENLAKLTKKINTIINKASKLGCGGITMKITGEEYKKENRHDVITEDEILINKLADINELYFKYITIEISGEAPHLDGWDFIATLQHLESGNIIRKYSDINVPEQYRMSAKKCDHCGHNRYRKDTYLIRNRETCEWKQVGSSCLADFFAGHNPHNVAKYAELVANMDVTVGGFYGHTAIPDYIETRTYLAYVLECIKHFGWTSATKAKEEYLRSTAELAYDEMFPSQFNCDPIIISDTSKETAEKALEWIKEQTCDNDYMHNLKTSCSQDYISRRLMGFVASLIVTYQKAIKPINHTQTASQYIGNIGDKIETTLTLIKSNRFDTQWGVSYYHKFTDNNGNTIVWKTNRSLETDKTYKIKGTIKELSEYKNNKETHITRCKVESI